MSSNNSVVTRYAPSPTGFQHIGGIRTALFAYLWARKNNGTFILRIEDTDKVRQVDGSIGHVLECLKWLDITYDFGPDKPGETGPYIQSERLASYKKYAQLLIEKGLAYPDPYTKEELEAFRAEAHALKQPFLYRNYRPENPGEWDGTQPLRLKVTDPKRYTWHDAVRGELSAGAEMVDDIILIKADGYPTYNFAHIIDDLEMGVTHVMRGEEFISSTPKFLSIYEALDITPPVFVTLPPILRDDRTKKLGKRDGAKDILDYRSDGYLPETMVNFLALVGWNPGTEQELFTHDELVEAFSLDSIQKSGAVFNQEKLLWMNREYIHKLTPTQQLSYIAAALPSSVTSLPSWDETRFARLAPTIIERIHTTQEFATALAEGEYDWLFKTPQYDTELLRWKKDDTPKPAYDRLIRATALLTEADFSSPDTVKTALWEYAETVGRGELLWPLRVALTGLERSPDPFTCAYTLGQSETLARIRVACDKIGSDA